MRRSLIRSWSCSTIRTGSTTFAVHIHASFACTACSVAPDSSNLIPLVAAPSDSTPAAPTPAYTGSRTKAQKEQDRREQMALLRGKLLKPAPGTSSSSSTTSSSTAAPTVRAGKPTASSPFIDRAAARRERNAHAAPAPFFAVPGRTATATAASAAPAPAPTRQAPADPFASDSRGARLLSKLSGSGSSAAGGAAGTTASASTSGGAGVGAAAGAGAGAGLGTLVEARTYAGEARDVRPGLGSRALVVGVERVGEARSGGARAGAGEGKRDWRGEGRERSYKRLRDGA